MERAAQLVEFRFEFLYVVLGGRGLGEHGPTEAQGRGQSERNEDSPHGEILSVRELSSLAILKVIKVR
jgi:hypothetical protein